jgi:hypothetical protein
MWSSGFSEEALYEEELLLLARILDSSRSTSCVGKMDLADIIEGLSKK